MLKVSVTWPVQDDIFNDYHMIIDGLDRPIFSIKSSDLKLEQIIIDKNPGELYYIGFEIYSGEEAPILAARLATKTKIAQDLPQLKMRLGSTKGTNALLEKKGANVGLIVTKGMNNLLEIGTQQRPDLFALNVVKNQPLYHEVFEVDERMDSNGNPLKKIDPDSITNLINEIKKSGVEAIAIALMNSSQNAHHELALAGQFSVAQISNISNSTSIANEAGILPRAETTVVNAYLSHVIEDYLSAVKAQISHGSLKVMTSAGGLVDRQYFLPKDSLLSGPAGGVVGAAKIGRELGFDKILTFDMGGTSTDVSRYAAKFDYTFISEINNIKIYSPTLAIETVAAGGGSICSYDGHKLIIGPESAGASPGPACYGNDGPLAITDINLLLGRIDDQNFSIPLDRNASIKAFEKVKSEVPDVKNDEEILLGFLRIANEKMAEAIRKISISKGYDPLEYTLLAFGGAGGQHACSVAELLNIHRIIIPFDAGLLSAYGIGNAEIERFVSRQLLGSLKEHESKLKDYFGALEHDARDLLIEEGIDESEIYTRSRLVFLRFLGQENTLEISWSNSLLEDFKKAYLNRFGHWLENESIEIESIKLIAASHHNINDPEPGRISNYVPSISRKIRSYTPGGWREIPAHTWEHLDEGANISGPALLMSNNSTVYIDEGWSVSIERNNNAILERTPDFSNGGEQFSDVAELELYTNRFKSVADDMGAILQRTSFSVNVKDRMDFSCAVLNSAGQLVANAPHIPVHLGSLGVCTRKVMEVLELLDGDVAITNHPGFGGSHLPDVTLIAPVFYKNELMAFVANRAHHAELGGKTPGSMPADASNLEEEGVVIEPTYLVRNHQSNWEEIRNMLSSGKFPTRSLQENLADLNGALASIKTGIDGMVNLCKMYGKSMVLKYMDKLLQYSGEVMLSTFDKFENTMWEAEEQLDDGHKIKVRIIKDADEIVFDFTGTSAVHPGNLNANMAILNSAVVYVLRLMLEEPIPLNEGIMKYVKIKAPESMLNPPFYEDPAKSPAVVGGNTETSQRIVDTLIKALELAACSQGTMNNLIFGNDNFGFYETIGGGVGAGNGFHGADAVHQHMTNTRITDPEILEYRYPVVLEEVSIRQNSGGRGKWKGGDGIVKQIRFEEDMMLTLLSQHRIERPFGLSGGEPGQPGKQVLLRSNGEKVVLKGIETIEVYKGDAIRIETPGGGGYGKFDN